MGLEISNAKLSIGSDVTAPPKRVKKPTTSIAEQAIFIPKPKKRVDFSLNNEIAPKELPEQNNLETKPVPPPVNNQNLNRPGKEGDQTYVTGKYGISANVTRDDYKVKEVRDYVTVDQIAPEKDFSFAPVQEEGRQVNHHQTHYTQQYDSYGRPRIGFSREPYDFAATKYIQGTSDLKFQQNVDNTREQSSASKQKAHEKALEREEEPLPESDDGGFSVKV